MTDNAPTISDYMQRQGWHQRVNGALMGVMSCEAFNAGCLAALSDPKLQQCSAESLGTAFLKWGGYLRIEYADGRIRHHFTSIRKILENKKAAGNSSVWRTYFAPMALKTIYRDAWARAAVSFEPGAAQAQHIVNAELHERIANDENPARVSAQRRVKSPAAAALTYDKA